METPKKRRPFKTKLQNPIPPEESIPNGPISTDDDIPNSVMSVVEKKIQRRAEQQQKKRCRKPIPTGVEYRPEVHPLIVGYLRRDGASEAEIAEVIGIEVTEFRRWCRIHPDVSESYKVSRYAACERVVRALMHSAIGMSVTDVERMYEMRVNPVTRVPERVLVREKESVKRSLPNPLACFFYLQNRDSARWSSASSREKTSSYTPEQVSMMMRTSASALADATLGVGLSENNSG